MNVIEPKVRISCSLTCKYLIDGVGYLSTEKDRQNKLLVSYRIGTGLHGPLVWSNF